MSQSRIIKLFEFVQTLSSVEWEYLPRNFFIFKLSYERYKIFWARHQPIDSSITLKWAIEFCFNVFVRIVRDFKREEMVVHRDMRNKNLSLRIQSPTIIVISLLLLVINNKLSYDFLLSEESVTYNIPVTIYLQGPTGDSSVSFNWKR